METFFLGFNFASTTLFQSFNLGDFTFNKFSFLRRILSTPCAYNSKGIEYTVSASCIEMTLLGFTEQNKAIFFFSSFGSSFSNLHIKQSGCKPRDLSSFTECWVGLVLSSSDTFIYGTKVRCASAVLDDGSSSIICLIASIKGWLSISPTVPPISTIAISAPFAPSLILLLISSVI